MPHTKNGFRREDRPGHLAPEHAARLRALTAEEHAATSSDAQRGFLRQREPGGPDLAQRLAEGAVLAVTTGQDELEDGADLNDGFVETTALDEMAMGIDLSNPEDATVEPFPTT